jgi:hypothetical protein
MMADHNGRVAVFSDEGGIFDIFAGRYDKQPNLDIWLQGHAGSPIRLNRIARGSLLIEKPALTIAVSPQPGVLAALRNSPMFRSRGLLARFLYALPRSAVGHRKLVPSRLDAAVRSAFRELIFRLWHLEQPITLPLTDTAYCEWKNFQHGIEQRMGDGEPLAGLRDWGSKLPGAALRLAAIFQATTSVEAITLKMMTAALAFATVFQSHALAVFGLIGSDPSIERADKVLQWLINRGVPVVDGRDVFNALQSSMKNMETFREAIQLLEEYGYVRATSRHGARGRHAMELEVNPKVWNVGHAGDAA